MGVEDFENWSKEDEAAVSLMQDLKIAQLEEMGFTHDEALGMVYNDLIEAYKQGERNSPYGQIIRRLVDEYNLTPEEMNGVKKVLGTLIPTVKYDANSLEKVFNLLSAMDMEIAIRLQEVKKDEERSEVGPKG